MGEEERASVGREVLANDICRARERERLRECVCVCCVYPRNRCRDGERARGCISKPALDGSINRPPAKEVLARQMQRHRLDKVRLVCDWIR